MAPAILQAIVDANNDPAMPYGNDAWTQKLTDQFSDIFGREVAVMLVATGTAANGLALAQLAKPFGGIICHGEAHILDDECGAPEFFTGGARLVPIKGHQGKLTPEGLQDCLTSWERNIHHVPPTAVSITQLSEWGTAYSPEEISALGSIVKNHDLCLHMDGSRFANALTGLGCEPADITWKAGVDVLSFGASKNGCMAAEAIVFFDPAKADDLGYRRKRAGHLWSKSRFISAQMATYLSDKNWLHWAAHANAMAARLAEGLSKLDGVHLIAPVDGNEIYLDMPKAMEQALKDVDFLFYDMPIDGRRASRLVTAWNTPEQAVDDFLGIAASAA